MRATIASLGLLSLAGPAIACADAAREPPAEKPAAAESRQDFSIAAQPLSQALRVYAQQSGDQIVFYSDVGKGREAPPVEGRFTKQEALDKLLENSGLQYQRVNAKTVAIRKAPATTGTSFKKSASAEPIGLTQGNSAAAVAEERAGRGSVQEPWRDDSLFGVEEVIVTGTAVAQRTKFETSVAISTFDSDDIAQQAPASSADLIAAVPGFWVESTSGTTQGNVFARGIIQDGGYRYVALMEDGIPIYPVSELSFYNPDQFVRVDETIERVEALRGGTAPIFTAGAVGGTINFVTRTARSEPENIVKAGVSDYGLYRGDFSWSAPIGDWGVAVGGYYRTSDGVRDPGYPADEGGQLRVKLGRTFEAGAVELFAKYIDDRSLFVVPIPLQGNPSDPSAVDGQDAGTYSLQSADLVRAPLPASAAEVGLQGSDLEDGIHPQLATIGASLRWELNEVVSLSNLFRYTDGEVRFDGIFSGAAPVTGTAFAAANGGVAPNYTVISTGAAYPSSSLVQNHGHWVVNKDYEALQNDVRLNFVLDTHALALGLYVADYSMADRWSLGNLLLMDASDQPRRLFLPGVTDADGYTRYSFFNLIADYDATAYSLYAADEWQVSEALRIDVGVRYDRQDIEGRLSNATNVDLDGNPATRYDNETSQAGSARNRVSADPDNVGYSIGFNYSLTPEQATFGHYTDAAKLPHFDDLRNGVRVEDNVTNIELGYKVSVPSLAVFGTLFQTEFDNVPFQDILAGGETVVRRAQTRTRGLELEGEWQPIDALSVRFSVTQQDPQYRDFTGSTVDNTGRTIRRIPKTMARITPTFSFLEDRARVYLTYSYVGKRYSNDENTIELPSYYKLDAGVMIGVGRSWTFQVVADNLTDQVGLTEGNPRTDVGAGGIGAVYMARPLFGRSFSGSVTFRY
jgi:iron complex outermembrane receptor protein